jgi:hypothetical protein
VENGDQERTFRVEPPEEPLVREPPAAAAPATAEEPIKPERVSTR